MTPSSARTTCSRSSGKLQDVSINDPGSIGERGRAAMGPAAETPLSAEAKEQIIGKSLNPCEDRHRRG